MKKVRVPCCCAWCMEAIEEGELVYSFNDELYHEECFEEKAVEMLKEQGAYVKTAEYEEAEEYEH